MQHLLKTRFIKKAFLRFTSSYRPFQHQTILNAVRVTNTGQKSNVSLTKTEAVRVLGLLPRDLLLLTVGFNRKPRPVIFARSEVFILCIGYLAAAVKRDEVFLFETGAADLNVMAKKLTRVLEAKSNETFECQVLDFILDLASTRYYKKSAFVSPLVQSFLKQLTNHKVSDSLEKLLVLKNVLSDFEADATLTRNCIYEVLQNNEDLGLMSFSKIESLGEQQTNLGHEVDHHEIELILENHVSRFVDIAQEAQSLRKRIEDAMSVIELQLDAYRNQVLYLNLLISTTALGLSFSTAVTGMFGMNLINHFEDHPFMFYFVCSSTSVTIVALLAVLLKHLNRASAVHSTTPLGSDLFNNIDEVQYLIDFASASQMLSKREFKRVLEERKIDISQDEVDIIYSSFNLQKRK